MKRFFCSKKFLGLLFVCLLFVCLLFICFIFWTTNHKKLGFEPPIKGIHWGMTSDQVIKKLNLTKSNITYNDANRITLSYENTSAFKQKANIEMYFDTQSEIGLCSMFVVFPNLNKDNLIKQLNSTYGKYTDVDANKWESKKISDSPKKIQDRFKYINMELIPKLDTDKTSSFALKWSDIEKQPLATVTLKDNTLEYKANNMASYTAFNDDDTYDKIVKKINNFIKNKKFDVK